MCKSFPPWPGPRQSPRTPPGGPDHHHPLQGTQHVLSAGFPSLLLPSFNLTPKSSSQTTVLYGSCFQRSWLGLSFAVLCHETLHPKQAQHRVQRGITPGTTVAVAGLGQQQARVPRPGSAFTSSHPLGTGDKTGSDRQKKRKRLVTLQVCNSNNTDGHALPKSYSPEI